MVLSLNIDHIATIRNARNSNYPDLKRAVLIAKEAGAEVVTIHLREDRRHIRDSDAFEICNSKILPVNFEIALTEEMLKKAIELKPKFVCFVPEKRQELTTEGGLDVKTCFQKLSDFTKILQKNGSEVSAFIEASNEMIDLSFKAGVNTVELHTGKFADFEEEWEFAKIEKAAKYAKSLGLKVHAGHGLTFNSAEKIAKIKEISILHIGHFLITESIFLGLANAVSKMKKLINQ